MQPPTQNESEVLAWVAGYASLLCVLCSFPRDGLRRFVLAVPVQHGEMTLFTVGHRHDLQASRASRQK